MNDEGVYRTAPATQGLLKSNMPVLWLSFTGLSPLYLGLEQFASFSLHIKSVFYLPELSGIQNAAKWLN